MKSIRIASRGSKLALAQAHYTRDLLKNLQKDIEVSIVVISTKGDRDKSDFLYKSESIGVFTSEVENALLDGRADLAVHSLKDLPTAITEGLIVAAIPKREDPRDALVSNHDIGSLFDLPKGASVGTSSLRRIAQVLQYRDDLKCQPLRGNVETRVKKVESGEVDAIIIAKAGLNRLGLAGKISAVLDTEEFVPAPGQGALAIQIRSDDEDLAELVSRLDDRDTRLAVEAERRVLALMHGGCSIPLGVHGRIEGDKMSIDAILSDPAGKNFIKRSASVAVKDAQDCAQAIAEEILAAGGKEILENIRKIKTDELGK